MRQNTAEMAEKQLKDNIFTYLEQALQHTKENNNTRDIVLICFWQRVYLAVSKRYGLIAEPDHDKVINTYCTTLKENLLYVDNGTLHAIAQDNTRLSEGFFEIIKHNHKKTSIKKEELIICQKNKDQRKDCARILHYTGWAGDE